MNIGSLSGRKKLRNTSIHEKLYELSMPVTESGCWIWLQYCLPQGHGRVFFRGRLWSTHRAAWEAFKGPIPQGAHVLHKCDVPCCVNPDHLYIGDHAQNMRDVKERGRSVGKLAGTKNPHSTLDDTKVREIRSRYQSGRFTQKQLSQEYGVAQTAISTIVRRQSWKHIK